ncbi:Cof-type HAD-IIB family hydrolase [Algoriphagus sp.]|uniref:Cof-type HAD-IIB family hydrolase n=1 Tax=Algoriphagus sp. TaxID=1872435 RepID=UPI0025F6E4D1|nr:Cof-type HAD-IIB family hydrolase [Algoriphagus sp.]
MEIKAFCSDVDGTLLNSDRDLSPRLKAIIHKLKADFPVILASSRMPNAMRHLVKDLGKVDQPLVSYNGGYVLSAAGEILDSVTIPLKLVQKIVELTKKSEIHVSLYQGENWYEEKDDYWSQREIRNTKTTCTWLPFSEVIKLWTQDNSGAHKVMCMGDSQEISWLFGELHFEYSKDLHLYRSSDTYLEIAPKAISKATGLKKILDHSFDFGMESVIAFGDNYNDIDLLQSVGYGVAVANARPEVKAVAKEITLHNKEDGVAATLEKLFL